MKLRQQCSAHWWFWRFSWNYKKKPRQIIVLRFSKKVYVSQLMRFFSWHERKYEMIIEFVKITIVKWEGDLVLVLCINVLVTIEVWSKRASKFSFQSRIFILDFLINLNCQTSKISPCSSSWIKIADFLLLEVYFYH